MSINNRPGANSLGYNADPIGAPSPRGSGTASAAKTMFRKHNFKHGVGSQGRETEAGVATPNHDNFNLAIPSAQERSAF